MRRILPSVAFFVGGIAVAVSSIASGDYAVGAAFSLVAVAAGVLLSPLPFPRAATTTDWQAAAEAGEVVVLHRPGCPYCLRLRFALGGVADRATWADIWADEAAAARVREATGGDETVPTVLVDGEAHVNPDPEWVRGVLAP